MAEGKHKTGTGPFRADGLEPDGYYEISNGHPIELAPSGTRHGNANITGALPLATDPMVIELGVDVGHKLSESTVRAPDISVGGVPADRGGWAQGAPPLAVEYADEGTKETDLQTKIAQYFDGGSKYVWVVRLVGLRRVEVYTDRDTVRTYTGRDELEAPGVLQMPAAALWDRDVALDVSMRNLLSRAGYRDIEQLRTQAREEGREVGREEGREKERVALVLATLEAKLGRALTEHERARALSEVDAGNAVELLALANDLVASRLR